MCILTYSSLKHPANEYNLHYYTESVLKGKSATPTLSLYEHSFDQDLNIMLQRYKLVTCVAQTWECYENTGEYQILQTTLNSHSQN